MAVLRSSYTSCQWATRLNALSVLPFFQRGWGYDFDEQEEVNPLAQLSVRYNIVTIAFGGR